MTQATNDAFKSLNEQIFYHMDAMRKDTSLMDCLIALQVAQGMDETTAAANATECILAVSAWEEVHAQISANSERVMASLFRKLEKLEESEQLEALHRILFGLTAYETPETARKLDEGTPAEQLFQDYYKNMCSAESPLTADELEVLILSTLGDYQLSPIAMRMLTRQMRSKDGYLAAAEALSEDGRNLKCLMTMETWLRNPGTMTMAEAANVASASAQTQAVADAVQRGYIARDMAKKLLIVIGITVAVFGIIYMVQSLPVVTQAVAKLAADPNPTGVPMSPLLASLITKQNATIHAGAIAKQAAGALLTLGGGAMAYLSDKGAEIISNLTLRFSHLFRKASDASDEDLEALAHEANKETFRPHAVPAEPISQDDIVEDEDLDVTFF